MVKKVKKVVATKAQVQTQSKESCNMCCPMTGAHMWRLLMASVLGFAFIFMYGYVVHHELLMPMYEKTKHMWRRPEEMGDYFHFMLVCDFIIAFAVAGIYSKYFGGCGISRGIRYGLLVGLLLGVNAGSSYAWLPISWELAQGWFLAGLIEGIGLGVICWAVFRTCQYDSACEAACHKACKM